ncbi:MAG: hypothetical protein ACI9LG_000524 [Moritella dasanensis]|jgi:hypothetical protein
MSIINSYHWFSNPTEFNDPFDCQIDLQSDEISVDEYMELYVLARHGEKPTENKFYETRFPVNSIDNGSFTSSFKNQLLEFGKHVKKEVKATGVLSLSENFDNTTMWSHYAENHQGICIEYAPDMMNEEEDIQKTCFKVDYLPAKDISFNIYELFAKCSNNHNNKQFQQLMWTLALTKSDDWKYEEEWRLIHNKNGIFRYSPLAIKGIYFGLKCGVEEKRAIRNILGDKLMSFFQMVKSSEGLSLDRVPMGKDSIYWSTYP